MTVTASPAPATLADRIDALLPQTQCQRCGYPACRPYAEAIASGEADIDQCPPGGDEGAALLASVAGRATKPVNPAFGEPITQPTLALIDEAVCIGCTKCIQACPVDAILGAAQRMHTVIADECTGCELCIPPCPVDCISMIPAPAATTSKAEQFRDRYHDRNDRLEREHQDRVQAYRRKKVATPSVPEESAVSSLTAGTAANAADPVARALAAARARRGHSSET